MCTVVYVLTDRSLTKLKLNKVCTHIIAGLISFHPLVYIKGHAIGLLAPVKEPCIAIKLAYKDIGLSNPPTGFVKWVLRSLSHW